MPTILIVILGIVGIIILTIAGWGFMLFVPYVSQKIAFFITKNEGHREGISFVIMLAIFFLVLVLARELGNYIDLTYIINLWIQ